MKTENRTVLWSAILVGMFVYIAIGNRQTINSLKTEIVDLESRLDSARFLLNEVHEELDYIYFTYDYDSRVPESVSDYLTDLELILISNPNMLPERNTNDTNSQ